jgi:[ribosomal protein S5]-alanine N-acetyltransferase
MAGTFSFPDDVPVLSDGVVTLRAHRLSDVDDVVVQCTDPESIRMTTVPVPYDREQAVEFVTTYAADAWRTHQDLLFAIETEHSDGRRGFSGSISLRPMPNGITEIAYGLHPGVRGRGVCSRAVKLILDWGFQQPDIEFVLWYAFVGNWGSWRVAWANGFSFDGTVEKFLPQRGVRRNAWCGSLRAGDTREPKHPWHVPPVLESDRLRLRPHRDDDAPRYAELLSDERSRYFAGWNNPLLRLRNPEDVVLRAREANAKGQRFDWTIADRDTDVFIGQIQMFNLGGIDDSSAELGYAVHPSWRGRGVLTEALGMVTGWVFNDLGLRCLTLGTAATNKASRHAAEKAGFVHVASLPEAFRMGEKSFEDEAVYQQLNPSWKG